ncbi:cation:proton antiporter [Streptomyces sp. FL06-04B]|uniref:cation:proton antiporter n=1 Tax=Streptomyces TaxID=1883 RepID=UPI0029BB0965|nr:MULTISPECIES: cation:proton antiporter [unclassified Streptomyces]MDX3605265.1 cation:proton antiporter [Streptomyces sp. FL06-04B]MDX3605290.1 cation:proton antiporter [Streptomyces sp. FL06-04B]MDX3737292.1 cation:proton antiporter [Streptomyces sp. ID01-15D]
MTDDEMYLGIALTLLLATGSQILASRLRVPALIILLPAGFTAGALTDVIHPDKLMGQNFDVLVSMSVAVILYDAGLGLNLRKLTGRTRWIVGRLLLLGVLVTFLTTAAVAPAMFDMPLRVASMLGVILVVSGPTVVGPLLDFVRPSDKVRRILIWEGTLTDPIGAILGALVFHAIATTHQVDIGRGYQIGQFALSLAVGLAGGAVGTVLLWLTLRTLRLGETLGTLAQLATVIVVSAGADIVRDDTGLIAAIVTGLAVTNINGFDMPARRPFFETLAQLIIGLLFISISSTITPASLVPVLLPALALIAILVLVVRPLVAYVSTARAGLTPGERAFVGWMAPRGIVAAATATAFSANLVDRGVDGAAEILPVTFLVIVGTVLLYALTAAPVARMLGIVKPAGTRILLVGGEPWVVDLGRSLKSAGLDLLMWAGLEQERRRITEAGVELATGDLLATATNPGARLEGVTAVFLATDDDDFNALASVVMQDSVEGPVYRVGPPHDSHGVVAPYTGGDILFGRALVRHALAAQYDAGARFLVQPASAPFPAGSETLFVIHDDLRLEPVTEKCRVVPGQGDRVVLLAPGTER